MRYKIITDFLNFNRIDERLGFLQEIDQLADQILAEIGNKDHLVLDIRIADKDIQLEIKIQPIQTSSREEAAGYMTMKTRDQFVIVMEQAQKNILVHELKHIHRKIKTDYKNDEWFYLDKIARAIAQKYEYLFKDANHQQLLVDTLYYCNPDEFEAHFQNLVQECKLELKSRPDEDPREVIQNFLNNEHFYRVLQLFFNREFDILDFFVNRAACQIFLDEFFLQKGLFINKKITGVDVTVMDRLRNSIRLFSIENKITSKSLRNQINKMINKVSRTGYKKIYRLFVI